MFSWSYWVLGFQKVLSRIPPVLGTFVFGIVMAGILGQLNYSEINIGVANPIFFKPTFTMQAIMSISIPLAMLVIGAENMQAYGVLKAEEYDAPINAMTIASGIGGLIAPWMGGHNANIAGPMTGICADKVAGDKDGRYVAGVANGASFALFGLFAPLSLSMIDLLPGALVSLLVGLVLMGIINSALQTAFGDDKFLIGSFTALVIAISGVSMLKIGAAFWALVIGTLVSFMFEREDFNAMRLESEDGEEKAAESV